jgi:hypothetical protein
MLVGDEKVPLLRSCMPCVLSGETLGLVGLKGRRRGWVWEADMMTMTGRRLVYWCCKQGGPMRSSESGPVVASYDSLG